MDEKPVAIGPIAPLFIVEGLARSVAFYVERLGFAVELSIPEESPFFAIVGRGATRVHLKEVGPEVSPLPNRTRHPFAAWDAFVLVDDPHAFADECRRAGLPVPSTLVVRDDGLLGVEVIDADGYVIFFGRPEGS